MFHIILASCKHRKLGFKAVAVKSSFKTLKGDIETLQNRLLPGQPKFYTTSLNFVNRYLPNSCP